MAGIAALLQWLIQPLVAGQAPFLLFLLALVFAVVFLGRGPALLVLLVGVLDRILLVSPMGTLAIHSPHDLAAGLIFAASGLVIVAIGNRLSFTSTRAALAEQRLDKSASARLRSVMSRMTFDAPTMAP